MRAWLLAVGFVSVLGQVTLLRELAVTSYGVELVYVLALGVWLAGGALGAFLLGKRDMGRASWFLAAALLVASTVFLRAARTLFAAASGAYLPLGTQLLTTSLALLPCSALLGALFPVAAKGWAREGRTLSTAYALESVGGLAGGAASSLLLRAGASNFTTLLLCAGAALLVSGHPWQSRPRWLLPALAPALAALAISLASSGPLDRAMTRWTHPALAATRDTPYGRVSAERAGELVSVFDNDALSFDTEGTDAEEFVNLAAVEVALPRRVLVLGDAAAGLVGEALKQGAESVEAVELDERWYALVLPLLPEDARRALASPKVKVHFADPRRFLEQNVRRWDLVLVGMPEPASAATNRFYTREFFALAARRVAAGGVLALRLPSDENLWTDELALRTSAVERALRPSFQDVLAVPSGTRLFLLASNDHLERDPDQLAGRLASRAVSARAATPEFIRFVHTNDRKPYVEALLARTNAVPNSDARPVCFRHAALLWLARLSPTLARRAESVADAGLAPWLVFAACAAAIALCRLSRRARPLALVGLAGFAGMVVESALVLHYQAKSGVLFQDLGLLLTVFMGGLAAGAVALGRRAPARPRLSGAALLVLLFATCLFTAFLLGRGAALGLWGTAALLAAAGAICGGLFAVASSSEEAQHLYAVDLAGGCLGAVAASLLFFPLLGLFPSLAALAPLGLVALFVV